MERRQDIGLGAVFAGLGATVAWMAGAYSGASGTYPLALGLALALCGAIIAGRALLGGGNAPRRLVDVPRNLTKALVAAIAYVALVVPLGFYTASTLLMAALPLVLGFRRPLYTLAVAVLFIAMVFAVFSLVLEKPLPADLWAASRFGGA